MCGIAGLLSSRAPVTPHAIATMTARLARRGPDGEGAWIAGDGRIGLGHRRLAIIDLTDAGHQPMASACGRYRLTYNGEIYNHAELRAMLEAQGSAPAWRGRSDTEVLLAAIAGWGIDRALARLAGMFAFALWDESRRELTLARDRFGEKPLYYGWTAAGFAFASTLAPFRALPGFDDAVAPDALAGLMARAYVAAPLSIYRRIYKLPPGCRMTVPADVDRAPLDRPPASDPAAHGGGPRIVRWFDPVDEVLAGAADPIADRADALDALDRTLAAAVRRQLVADVAVGTFLSGGIDSSLVTAFAQAAAPRPIRTFTIGFHEAAYDEAHHARAVAAALGTDHAELYVGPTDVLGLIPELPALYDEPFADSSQLPTHLVARLARTRVTVALSGDGGDELFGGYNRHIQIPAVWRRIRRLPPPLRRALLGAAATLPPQIWNRLADAIGRAHAPLFGENARRGLRAMAAADGFDTLIDGFLDDWAGRRAPLTAGTAPPLASDPRLAALPLEARMMHLDAVTYLPDDILAKVDRAAMGAGLETRVPFLDPAVTALAARIGLGDKIGGGSGKLILRTLLHRHVPRALVDRPKAGFAVPIGRWLRGPLRDWAEALLSPAALEADGLFDAAVVRERWRRHLIAREDATQPLWSILMFQAWRTASTESMPG